MADKIQYRRDTLAQWKSVNPTLSEGEIGYITDKPGHFKIGDGSSKWNELPIYGIVQFYGNRDRIINSGETDPFKLYIDTNELVIYVYKNGYFEKIN